MLVSEHLWRDDIVNLETGNVEAYTWTALDDYVLCDGNEMKVHIDGFDINDINKWQVMTVEDAQKWINSISIPVFIKM